MDIPAWRLVDSDYPCHQLNMYRLWTSQVSASTTQILDWTINIMGLDTVKDLFDGVEIGCSFID